MVLREKELRLSEEWQDRFAAAERSNEKDWLDCVEDLQALVVREFGFESSAVHVLRAAHSIHPAESFFKEVPIQVRYNRARNGPLSVGAEVENVPLVSLKGLEIPLSSLGGFGSTPLVVIGGSRS